MPTHLLDKIITNNNNFLYVSYYIYLITVNLLLFHYFIIYCDVIYHSIKDVASQTRFISHSLSTASTPV